MYLMILRIFAEKMQIYHCAGRQYGPADRQKYRVHNIYAHTFRQRSIHHFEAPPLYLSPAFQFTPTYALILYSERAEQLQATNACSFSSG